VILSRFVLVAAVLSQACSPSPPLGARHPVDTSNKTVEVQASVLERDWVFVEIDGYDGELPSPPPAAGFIVTSEGSRVTGTTACNRLGSGYQLDTDSGTLRFTSLRNTRMMCDRVAADTEEAVLAAMIATDGYRLSGNTLELLSKGRVVARLTSAD
jgi:heat shock protein HslJ